MTDERIYNLIIKHGDGNYGGILRRVYEKFSNIELPEELVHLIEEGQIESDVLFNTLVNGRSKRPKPHCSGKYPSHENELRQGGKNGARRDSIRRNH